MFLLKSQYSILWIILCLLTGNISVLFLGYLLKVYEKDAWYTRWYYWVLGFFFDLLPALVMLLIFVIEITVKVCKKLKVPGAEVYGLPYVWIGCAIIPIVGWTLFLVLLIYINLWYLVKLCQGKGEECFKTD